MNSMELGRKGFFFMQKNWHLTIQKQAKDCTLSVRPHSDIHGMMACWAAYNGVVCNNRSHELTLKCGNIVTFVTVKSSAL